jgi:hypothetical protein
MNFLKLFRKKLNKTINKGLIVYTNNTRIVKNKRKQLTRKIVPEFKELVYDFLLYWENPNRYLVKFLLLLILMDKSFDNVYPILKGYHNKMLLGHKIIHEMKEYQTENIYPHKLDKLNEDKIMLSYWANYL